MLKKYDMDDEEILLWVREHAAVMTVEDDAEFVRILIECRKNARIRIGTGMGVSQWRNLGEECGYSKFFEKKEEVLLADKLLNAFGMTVKDLPAFPSKDTDMINLIIAIGIARVKKEK